MYKLIRNPLTGEISTTQRIEDGACIPFDPMNSDFAAFKQAINDDTAQLADADGNLMTSDEAKTFVAELP